MAAATRFVSRLDCWSLYCFFWYLQEYWPRYGEEEGKVKGKVSGSEGGKKNIGLNTNLQKLQE